MSLELSALLKATRVNYASVAHPQSNGQAERANGLILKGLKPRLMRDLKQQQALGLMNFHQFFGV